MGTALATCFRLSMQQGRDGSTSILAAVCIAAYGICNRYGLLTKLPEDSEHARALLLDYTVCLCSGLFLTFT